MPDPTFVLTRPFLARVKWKVLWIVVIYGFYFMYCRALIIILLLTTPAFAADGGTQQYIIALQNFTTTYDCNSPLGYQIQLAGFQFYGISPSADNPNLGNKLTNYTLTPTFGSLFDGYTELYSSETATPVPFTYNFTQLDDNLNTYISDTLINGASCINPSVLQFNLTFSKPEILTQWRVGFPTKFAYNTVVPRQFVLMKTDYTVVSSGSYTANQVPNYGWVDMKIRDVFRAQSDYYQYPTIENAQLSCSQSEHLVYQQYLLDFNCLTDTIDSNVYLCYHTYTALEDCKQHYYHHYHVVPESNITLEDIFNQGIVHMMSIVAFLGMIAGILLIQH